MRITVYFPLVRSAVRLLQSTWCDINLGLFLMSDQITLVWLGSLAAVKGRR